MAYRIYLGEVLFPVAPSKMKMKINGRNQSLDLIDGGEINVLNPAGLTEIEFDVLLPAVRYPFADYENGFEPPDYYLEELERMKLGKRPVRFIVIRELPAGDSFFDTNMAVSLEEYTISEDAKDGIDLTVSVSLKQFVHYGVKRIVIRELEEEREEAAVSVEEERETSGAPKVSSYAVQEGDCLWNIAKRCMGDGSRWPEIYELNRNKVNNPNRLSPGMTLVMPR